MFGEGHCARGKNPCPEDESECEKCGEMIDTDDLQEYGHNFWVCEDCLEKLGDE